jgi:hypothetical protein
MAVGTKACSIHSYERAEIGNSTQSVRTSTSLANGITDQSMETSMHGVVSETSPLTVSSNGRYCLAGGGTAQRREVESLAWWRHSAAHCWLRPGVLKSHWHGDADLPRLAADLFVRGCQSKTTVAGLMSPDLGLVVAWRLRAAQAPKWS